MTIDILAPLSGKVLLLSIKVGDRVEEDEELMVIEAMKTETPVFSPCDGTIKEVRVSNEDEVEEQDVLAVIDKT
ncbi:acetyl-CoA carboxylase biotin carboxyl carrier protein subunit [Thermodesulfobacteriota bacterium]